MYSSAADCSGTSTMMIANDTAQSGFGPALPPPSAAPGSTNSTAVSTAETAIAMPPHASIQRQRSRPAADEMRPTRLPLTMSEAST